MTDETPTEADSTVTNGTTTETGETTAGTGDGTDTTVTNGTNDTTDLTVRPARAADAERVCAVHGAAIRELGSQAYSPRQVAAWDHDRSPADYAVDGDVPFLVAERDEVVGFGELQPDPGDYLRALPDDYGEVRAVYVHPDAARSGVGTRLLRALETRAREHDRAGLGLWASLNAVGFYERRGYEPVAERTHEFGDSGVTGTVVEMRREL